jgi:hypothetical protein
MVVINKGISKAVKEAFINGVHEPDQMLVKLAHLNTDQHRKSYIITLTKALREKHGMNTKRNKRYGKKQKKTDSNKQLGKKTLSQQIAESLFGAGLVGQRKYTGEHDLANAMRADNMRRYDMSNMADRTYDDAPKQRISDEDKIIEEYIKKDDELRALQMKYDDIVDNNAELKREIIRLQVIISYLEGRK